MEVLFYLTGIAIILLIGLLVSLLSNKLKIPNVLLLILTGILLSFIRYNSKSLFEFSPTFLLSISILALVMIVFDGASRLKLKDIDKQSYNALKVTGLFILFNLVFTAFITELLFFREFDFLSIILSLVFAILVSGTDPGNVFIFFKEKLKVLDFLKIEAIFNTPIIVLLPFMLIDLITKQINLLSKINPFLQQIVTGVGTGIVVGLIIFKSMRTAYSEQVSPVALLTATLLTYILSENLGGSGVLAVATLGLLFGNMYVKNKIRLSEFSSMLSSSLEILVFVLLGFIIKIDLSLTFFIKSLIIFVVIILNRYLALLISVKKDFNKKEILFMSLNLSKGIAVATVIFSIALLDIKNIHVIVNLTLITMIYSLILSTVVSKLKSKFIDIKE